mmetsp:Transcript_24800/g.74387  ORF Transcript_24800/g.74387 Transcript_24800/m.74387 type:complete len:427 (-) Transcript_24800:178-1458(-)
MGIKGLFPFLRDNAPETIKETQLKDYLNRTLAIDASMQLYSLMAAVRTGADASNLTNSKGEETSHIQGFVSKTLRLMEAGAKPVWVFDGKPPDLKGDELKARAEQRRAAEQKAAETRADAAATKEDVYKAASAATRVTRQHNEDVKTLLRLMGAPVVEAPGEAEASCCALLALGKADGAVTEDADVLTFGCGNWVKNLFDVQGARSKDKGRQPAYETNTEAALRGLDLTMAQFVDFCILSGCDYIPKLPGIGAATALKLIKEYGCIERATVRADARREAGSKVKGRPVVSPDWNYAGARALFAAPAVVDSTCDVAQKPPDYEGLERFLCGQHGFAADRVAKFLARLRKCKEAKPQRRIDDFVTRAPKPRAAPRPGTAAPPEAFAGFAAYAAPAPAAPAARRVIFGFRALADHTRRSARRIVTIRVL